MYANTVACLMYLMVTSHAVSVASMYVANLGIEHWNVVKWIFRYLAGTRDYGILFDYREITKAMGYVDDDYAENLNSRRFMTCYVFMFTGGPIYARSLIYRI